MAKVEMGSNADCDRNVENHSKEISETSTSKSMSEAESEPTRYRHVIFIVFL